MQDSDIVQTTLNYIEEAKEAKRDRMRLNVKNFDCFHYRQDFSHKIEGQSREFLPKQALAVEQIVSFFQQALVEIGEWYGVEKAPGVVDALFTDREVRLLLNRQLEKAGLLAFVGDGIKLGLLGSLIISKIHGELKMAPVYYTELKQGPEKNKQVLKRAEKRTWQLKLDLVRQEDFYPDPSGSGLFLIAESYLDLSVLQALDKQGLFDKGKLDELAAAMGEEEDQKQKRAKETNQNVTFSNYRRRAKIAECWGNVIDSSGKVVHENVTWIVGNDTTLLKAPVPNQFWHGENPYVVAPIIRVPNSVWHRAFMDAPTAHNTSLNELFNLVVDCGMMATYGIKQARVDWLEDQSQVSGGVKPGDTLKVNSNCPPGMKVLERVDTASMSSESLQVLNLINQEFNQSALTNDLRMGVMPSRAVKATEVVEASQSITSVFTGMAKVLEVEFLEKLLEKAWLTILQNMQDLDAVELKDLFGEERATMLSSLSPEERFARAANGHKFMVYGITRTLSKVKDFRKLTSLLQTIGGSQTLTEEFMRKYDFGKLLEEIMRSLDVNTQKIALEDHEQASMSPGMAGGFPVEGGPDMQSQIPQASTGPLTPTTESLIPRTDFPPQARGQLGG